MLKKILIANRGEIALRIIRTCKEMGIKTVAVYSQADKDSLHVRFADEAICIGPAKSQDSYLNIANIISSVELTNADAIHPGYGFLSESARFSGVCKNYGIKFIGPTPEQISSMGDKASAKQHMIKSKIPVIPGSDGVVADIRTAHKEASSIGYPVILKATAGGGGKGMRVVWAKKELENAFEVASREAQAAFNNSGLYIEKFIEQPRHIEIQIVGDGYGKVCHLSERDCSIQRRHQKLVEESPSPFMTRDLRKKMGSAAIRVAKSVNYEGAGTVEFLVDNKRNFYFMEMNTRIQVEHPVTEEVIGYDLIKEQIKVASGVPVSGKNYMPNCHAIEFRINAEDPFNNFTPSPGKIINFNIPGGYGVRVDTHVYAGYTIPQYYDSMIAKLICKGETREEAINKGKRALSEFVIEGVKTTIPFHKKLLENKDFKSGNFTTKLLDNFDLTP